MLVCLVSGMVIKLVIRNSFVRSAIHMLIANNQQTTEYKENQSAKYSRN